MHMFAEQQTSVCGCEIEVNEVRGEITRTGETRKKKKCSRETSKAEDTTGSTKKLTGRYLLQLF
jgi:hypothetical protein